MWCGELLARSALRSLRSELGTSTSKTTAMVSSLEVHARIVSVICSFTLPLHLNNYGQSNAPIR